ncbi:winged helix-turn-helix DNA binding protein [Raoultella ornithinolytica]|uniref:Winged helix-turn-helix DNA binding protein n=1 Tax=Raoultella ornithinolytica TaxID=54291 RepID=A0ABD7QC75_RAOOR|nr:winged helix-turn-helix DNA binding protein [Raoultella ornithinolytica]
MKLKYSTIISEYKKIITQDEPIIKSFATPDNIRIIKQGEIFRIENNEIILVLSGVLAINMQQPAFPERESITVAHEEPFRVGKAVRGMVLGLVESFGPSVSLQYVAKQDSKIATQCYDDFVEIFTQKEQFKYLIKMTAFTLTMLLDSYNERNFSNRYNVIRSMIYRYKIQQSEGILHDDSLASFILKRTKISRSYLFQILADLKDGGYIDVRNGKLYSILKELPEKY